MPLFFKIWVNFPSIFTFFSLFVQGLGLFFDFVGLFVCSSKFVGLFFKILIFFVLVRMFFDFWNVVDDLVFFFCFKVWLCCSLFCAFVLQNLGVCSSKFGFVTSIFTLFFFVCSRPGFVLRFCGFVRMFFKICGFVLQILNFCCSCSFVLRFLECC